MYNIEIKLHYLYTHLPETCLTALNVNKERFDLYDFVTHIMPFKCIYLLGLLIDLMDFPQIGNIICLLHT